MARLNGLDGEWGVEPLPPASPVPRPLEPLAPLQLSGGDERARLEAAHALIVNHEQVARFAARGASDPGKLKPRPTWPTPTRRPQRRWSSLWTFACAWWPRR